MPSILARLSTTHRVFIILFTIMILAAIFFLPNIQELKVNQETFEIGKHYPLPIDAERLIVERDDSSKQHQSNLVFKWENHTVKNGESASVLFSRVGVPARILQQLLSSNDEIEKQLTRLKPGDKIQFGFDKEHNLLRLSRRLSPFSTFVVTKTDDQFTSRVDTKEIFHQYNYAEASITSNFWNAAITAGLNANQIMELAGIFGWDIDFALDIRANDSFQVLYQEDIVEGEIVGKGKIIAAIFTNQGTTFTAVYDQHSGNYYDENGRAMKKAFLRSPVDFRRVSSDFNPRRLHPVTGQVRAHNGTDYAAPVGTPVWAAGDGIVEKAGYNQFNGNYVYIRHTQQYMTKYLHLQRRMVNQGQRVKQGQTIGTLGATGRVTGPHLHYEFLVNGTHKNPRTVALPQAVSLTGKKKTTFVADAQTYMQQLRKYQHFFVK